MGVTTNLINKPFNPRGNDQSPKGYNRASLFSGKALDFDGVNDYIDVPYLDSLANTGVSSTFSFYFNADALTGNMVFAEQRKDASNRYVVWYDHANPQIQLYINSVSYSVSFPLTETGRWFYFTGVVDGSTAKMYINGKLIGSTSYVPFESNVDFYLGTYNGASDFFYNGKMTNAKIFNTALTAAQVADLYNNPEKVVPTGLESNLKLWLPMMEGAGTTAYDGSGNGNHGTISGATYVNGVGAPVAQSAVMDWNKGSNKLINSSDLTTSWSLNETTIDSGYSAPDGSNTAFKITKNVGAVSPYAVQSSVTEGDDYRAIYARTTSGTGTANLLAYGANTNNLFTITEEWQKFSIDAVTTATAETNFYLVDFRFSSSLDEIILWAPHCADSESVYIPTIATAQTSEVLLPQGLTTGRDITGVNLFENVRKQGALNLDGNSWAEVHDNASLDITSAITLEAWAYVPDDASNKILLSKWSPYATAKRSYLLFLNNSENVYFGISLDGQNSVNLVTSSTYRDSWFHFVATYDGANMKIYANGTEVTSQAQTGSIYNGTFQLEIGRHQGELSAIYPNQIAQPRIYNRALTASEVLQNYNSGKNTYK
jgi:hypothetical protein